MHYRSYVALAALVLAVFASPLRCALAAGEIQEIIQRGDIRVGYIPSPPTTIKDSQTGEIRGVYVDGLRAIVEQMG
ncbi:MAG: hypothetical protein ACHQF3_14010, partial [Alphaproteobacteria bacterium]